MKQNINDVIGSCDQCQRRKTLTIPTKETITKPKQAVLFEVIFINFCRSFKMTITGKKYILPIIDQFCRYGSLNAVARQDVKTTADIIKNNWILKFGAPKMIHCDKGNTFESNLIKNLASGHKMQIVYSSPGVPKVFLRWGNLILPKFLAGKKRNKIKTITKISFVLDIFNYFFFH